MSLIWINGQLIDKSEARVSPFDHGFLYGDGVWEPLRVFNGRLFRAEDHIRQLFETAARHKFAIPLDKQQLLAAVEQTVSANERTDGYVRIIITRGSGTLGPDPRKLDPQVMVIAEEYRPFPVELYDQGLHAVSLLLMYLPNLVFHGRTLGMSYLVEAKRWAVDHGCLEAIICYADHVVGCIEGIVYVVNEAMLQFVGGDCDVTCDVVIRLAIALRITTGPTYKIPFRVNDLVAFDEAFIAGTSCGIIGIVQVDGKPIGSGTEGPITRRIREAYRKLTRGEG